MKSELHNFYINGTILSIRGREDSLNKNRGARMRAPLLNFHNDFIISYRILGFAPS
jgi:hypothetical protein